MTNITIQSEVGRFRLTAVGHATGSSEVCAAVSSIVYALGGYLKNLEAAGAAELPGFMLESGAAEIEASGQEARAAFEMAAIGLMQIAAKYPDHVSVDARNFFKSQACGRLQLGRLISAKTKGEKTMKEQNEPVMLALLPVVLDLFDGSGAAAAGGGTSAGGRPSAGGGAPDSGTAPGSTAAGGKSAGKGGEEGKVLYGKQPDHAWQEPAPAGEQNPQHLSTSDTLEDRQRRYRELMNGEFKDLYDEDARRLTGRSAQEAAALRDQAARVQPVLDMLMDRYKIGDSDMGKLLRAVENDSAYWSQAAEEAGMSVEQYKQFQRLQRQNQELMRQQRARMGQERADAQLQAWNAQAEQLKAVYPSFDLTQEAQNRDFLSMLKAGVPVRQAYEVVHMDEIKAATAQMQAKATEKAVTANIKAKGARPQENGTGAASGFTIKDDVSRLTRKDRAEIARRAARGETITF